MATNHYFNHYGTNTPDQRLVESIVIESIKSFGIDVHYMPRTQVNTDSIFGEDRISKFEDARMVEVYVKSVDGFEVDGTFVSNFGQAAFIAAQELIKIELLEKRFSLMSSEFSQSSHQDLTALIAAIGQWFMPTEPELQEASLFFLMQQSNMSIAENFADSLQQSTACIGRLRTATAEAASTNLDQCKQDVITLLSNLSRGAGSLQVVLPNLD